ncbi:MAG: hypothetical protein V4760_16705 [Bdellovibrionota bacterium]
MRTPLNIGEISDIASLLQPMVGSQLQECVHADTEVGLGFYHGGKIVYLWFDLDPRGPVVVRVPGSPPTKKKVMRPLSLFVRSRFLGRRLASVRADLARGRVLVFAFHRAASEGTDAPIEFEALLLPHAPNLIARDGKASVAESKPKELPVSTFEMPPAEERRSWEAIEDEWLAQRSRRPTGQKTQGAAADDVEKKWRRAVEKKKLGLERMEADLAEKSDTSSRELGEWLKANGSLDELPVKWRELVDEGKSLSWNIENAFKKAKDNERKLDGARERIVKVRGELAELEAKGPGSARSSVAAGGEAGSGNGANRKNMLAQADARGRTMKLADDLDCYIGKNAGDNLALLRRAQPFDLWLHLRESPGSHAIIRRTRGRNVTDGELLEAGKWVAAQSFGKRAANLKGQSFDLLIVECRYVRPIKGDKLGRVNYTHDRVMRITL